MCICVSVICPSEQYTQLLNSSNTFSVLCQIFTDQIVTHLDTNFFDEPRKFDPARFHNQSSIPPYCFLPFGGGPRMCPGNEFAKTGTLVAMHYLVRQFRWKLCCKEGYRKDPTPMPLLGLPIDLETRSPPGYAHS